VGRLLGHPRLPELIATLREMGWGEVEVDLQGYRQGRMNVLT
jgi:PP-loop superfamily ATP-utilizing enzyme